MPPPVWTSAAFWRVSGTCDGAPGPPVPGHPLIGIPLALALAACGLQSGATGTPPVSDQTRVSVDPGEAVAPGDVVAAADIMGLDLIVGAGDVSTVTSPASPAGGAVDGGRGR